MHNFNRQRAVPGVVNRSGINQRLTTVVYLRLGIGSGFGLITMPRYLFVRLLPGDENCVTR